MTDRFANVTTLTWQGVTARRMARHALSEPKRASPADLASVLCGVHAQVLIAAEFSIGRRIASATRRDVQRALWEDRTLVKTFGPRGTVHLLATADLPMWTGALSVLPSSVPTPPYPVRFTPQQAEEVIAAIGDALATAELTVDELTEAIEQRTGPWAVERIMDAFQTKWPRWRQLTSIAGQRGVLCFGANRGRNVTYTNPHRWLSGFRPADGNTALSTLVRRYLYAYGPATPQHFAKWLNLPPRTAIELFNNMTSELEQVDLEGMPAWVVRGDTDVPREPYQGVTLLPYFDAYAVVGQPREWLYPGAAATRALSPTRQAGNYPIILINGVVGGVWHLRRAGKNLMITAEPLEKLTALQQRQLAAEAELVGAVLEGKVILTIGRVTAGAHA